jgi:hypothetical protein
MCLLLLLLLLLSAWLLLYIIFYIRLLFWLFLQLRRCSLHYPRGHCNVGSSMAEAHCKRGHVGDISLFLLYPIKFLERKDKLTNSHRSFAVVLLVRSY